MADFRDTQDDRVFKQDDFAATLAGNGYAGVLVLRRETGQRIFTDDRLTIIDFLDEHEDEIDSIRDLARELGRGEEAVKTDLQFLARHSIIDYVDGNGGEYRPVLRHRYIVIEPLRF